MRNTMKVAKWEIKRNMKNKSFIIGLFLTPILFIVFASLGSLFGNDSTDENDDAINVFVNDQLGVFDAMDDMAEGSELIWNIQLTDLEETDVMGELESSENTAYLFVDERAIDSGVVPYYTSED